MTPTITQAEVLADQICGCANREQHRRDVALLNEAFAPHRELGAREERARVVEWLRQDDAGRGLVGYRECWNVAAMIERGEHLAMEVG